MHTRFLSLGMIPLCALALGSATQRAWSQTPPTPPAAAADTCPKFGWAEGLVKYLAPSVPFPTDDTKSNPASHCDFHQWSWEAFVWATAIDPTTKQPRFLTLPNLDALGQAAKPELAKVGPKPLVLKPRNLKPRGSQQDIGEFQQAGSAGVLVDPHGQAVYYSQHANPTYFAFVQKYYGVAAYQKAPPTLNFPLGSAVFKASWRIVAQGENASAWFTTQAIVPMLVNNPKGGGIMIDPSGKTRTVTVALVGLHVVGVTANHPEFLWASFEQVQNAPDLPPTVLPPDQPVSTKDFTFYKAGTLAANCNVLATVSVSDPASQTLAPITNVYRQFAYGGEDPAGVTQIKAINSGAQSAAQAFPNGGGVWANYQLLGTVWTAPNSLKPGDGSLDTQAVGSITLANSTMETFVQGPQTNCFSCHNTGGDSSHNIPGKNVNLSHKLLEPLFNNPAIKVRATRRLMLGRE